ncbi:RNA polymerase sigma factor SigJ [Hirschia maritima]|uniref:RNA polymerase sigma factor SigJ n=1 Tax=Hirschia maritima TaxID=1121961 RepID=UPI0003651F96|nr:RNA polymerase sigma factor SigJ [Hirschia maritima]
MNEHTAQFESERPKLISLCYRMLGQHSHAEDAVQDTWIKWAAADKSTIHNPSAWLRKVATNIAIDTLKSAAHEREVYFGPWLPEPILSDDNASSLAHFELAQECELALLWAMERLNAKERAAFILREAFDASYAEIASTLQTSEAACRQLVSRSQKKLQDSGPRFDATPAEIMDLTQKFFLAVATEEYDQALKLLAPNATAISDGGTKKRAARRPLHGCSEILQVLSAIWKKTNSEDGWSTRMAVVNRNPSILRYKDSELDSVITIAPSQDTQIGWIYILRNPEKLLFIRHQLEKQT